MSTMKYEVEQKFPVADLAAMAGKLLELGATFSEPQEEVDRYYAHPARDFASTDEALRIRCVGPRSWITYKGPKIDATTKTRREIELPLSPPASGWEELLEALGFVPVAEVRKGRRKAIVPWQGRRVTATLDDVRHVGTFVELELSAVEGDLEPAKGCLAALARVLELEGSVRESYLELLLESKS
ncbi:MAG: class IV adenylate cyclase [Planctomycetota bacterium]|jgi:adenylate cyclase class 2